MDVYASPQPEGQNVITYSLEAQFTNGGGVSKA